MQTPVLPCFLPVVDLRTGRTTELELLSCGMLADAIDVVATCWDRRPDVGLLVALPPDALESLVTLLDRAGADRSRVAVQVPAGRLHEAARIGGLGLRLAVGALGSGPVDLAALCALEPSLVRVDASSFTGARGSGTLAAGVGLGRTAGATVIATSVDTPTELRAAGRAGADAVQGLQAAPLLVGMERAVAHLEEEGVTEPVPLAIDPLEDRLDQLAAQAARIESLVVELSGSVDRPASSAGPRSVRSVPPGR